MRISKTRIHAASLFLAVVATGPLPRLLAADAPATAPATVPAAPVAAPRSPMVIMGEARSTHEELLKALEGDVYSNAATRAAALKTAGPLMDKLAAIGAELATTDPRFKGIQQQIEMEVDPARVALGDADTQAKLEKMAASDTAKDALLGKALLAKAKFLTAGKDDAAQAKALDGFSELLKANPTDNTVPVLLAGIHENPAASPATTERIETMLKTESQSRAAKSMVAQWESHRKLAAMENKPLVMKATKLGGSDFSTEELKGKVILVDFWATWCGPCKAELPRVKAIYQKYHTQGLEIVGVSCDQTEDALKDFLQKDPEMSWTQLFDSTKPGWHQLAKDYGITGIPTMFLIDKKGVLRTVEAREKMEDMIPKLLAE